MQHVLGPDDGSKCWHSCAPCLLAAVFSTPLLSLVTTPPLPPLLHSLFSLLLHTPHRAPSHWRPSSRTLPVRAPTSRANSLSQSKIFESVQDATSSPCQIFGSVQTPPAARAIFSIQSKTPHQQPVPNFRASPIPLSQIFEPVQDHCALLRQK